MPVPAAGDWAGKLDTSGVNGLEYARVVDPSGDFLNEDGGQSLAPQFLVDAETWQTYCELQPQFSQFPLHFVDDERKLLPPEA